MTPSLVENEKSYLAALLETIQRCVFFLDASSRKLTWPVHPEDMTDRKRDVDYFESLAAINERFAKLQDTLGTAMRRATLLSGEPADSFLRVLAFHEKTGVTSTKQWQLYRTVRNLAAHDYETDYTVIAEHFNSLHDLLPALYADAARFNNYCEQELDVAAASNDFRDAFMHIASGRNITQR